MATVFDDHFARLAPRGNFSTNATAGSDFSSQIDAYSLPYGILGIVSHFLTCYVILCHYFGRTPAVPWRYLEFDRWNIAVVVTSSVVSTSLAVAALIRVRGSGPLMTLAGMQIVLSSILDFITVHRYLMSRRSQVTTGWIGQVACWGAPLLVVSFFSVYPYTKFTGVLQLSASLPNTSPRQDAKVC
jgi:hypothetical protein